MILCARKLFIIKLKCQQLNQAVTKLSLFNIHARQLENRDRKIPLELMFSGIFRYIENLILYCFTYETLRN